MNEGMKADCSSANPAIGLSISIGQQYGGYLPSDRLHKNLPAQKFRNKQFYSSLFGRAKRQKNISDPLARSIAKEDELDRIS